MCKNIFDLIKLPFQGRGVFKRGRLIEGAFKRRVRLFEVYSIFWLKPVELNQSQLQNLKSDVIHEHTKWRSNKVVFFSSQKREKNNVQEVLTAGSLSFEL